MRLTLPRENSKAGGKPDELPQHPAIDLDFDLSGCEATWKPAGGGATWTGWLPHFDLDVSRQFTKGSAPHDALWAAMAEPGELRCAVKLDLIDMLRPAVQPGSKIDYEYPPESVTVAFNAASPKSKLQVTSSTAKGVERATDEYGFSHRASQCRRMRRSCARRNSSHEREAAPRRSRSNGRRTRTIGRGRSRFAACCCRGPIRAARRTMLSLPSARPSSTAAAGPAVIANSSARRRCARSATRYTDAAARSGPTFRILIHRDYASVLRDIAHPSFAINPDYLSYTVVLNDGRVLDRRRAHDRRHDLGRRHQGRDDHAQARRRRRNAAIACLDDARKAAGAARSRADARFVDVSADAPAANAARSSGAAPQAADTGRSERGARRRTHPAGKNAADSCSLRRRSEGSWNRRARLSGISKSLVGIAGGRRATRKCQPLRSGRAQNNSNRPTSSCSSNTATGTKSARPILMRI